MILLDTTIVNNALPSMVSSLRASVDQMLWVLDAFRLQEHAMELAVATEALTASY